MAPMAFPAPQAATRSDDPCRSPRDLEALLGIGITAERAAGQTIIVEGDPRTHGFRVLTGAVRLYKALPDGRRQVLDFLTQGGCFGLFGAEHYAYSVEAIVPSALARYPRANLEAALRASPEVALRLLDAARSELEQAQVHMLLLGRKTAEEKVAAFLVIFAERLGSRAADAVVLRLPMTRQDMADYLGLTIETVSRTLTRLRQQGLISLASPQDVIVRRRVALEALAHASA
jgi:CRP/FNR family transcriptional regulator, anaerobic regulatory protein